MRKKGNDINVSFGYASILHGFGKTNHLHGLIRKRLEFFVIWKCLMIFE